MPTIHLTLPTPAPISYEIRITPGILANLGPLVRAVAPAPSAGLISDTHVAPLYLAPAKASLEFAGYRVIDFIFPAGESNKTLATASAALDRLLNAKVERATPIIALGGGVVGDLAGFVSATLLRGTPFIQCPTTLLAAVDASVGGKVGVDHPAGKNLIGAFHQPRLVLTDVATFQTLPARELRCGLAECIKHAIIRDPSLFAFIAQNLSAILPPDPAAERPLGTPSVSERAGSTTQDSGLRTQDSLTVLSDLVARNVQIKADIVMQDPYEKSVRALLNLGHTTAHALETLTGYGTQSSVLSPQSSALSPKDSGLRTQDSGLQHGEAVSLGIVVAARLAVSLKKLSAQSAADITNLLARAGLPTSFPNLNVDQTYAAMATDKKVAASQLRFILPTSLGSAEITTNIPPNLIREALASLAEPGNVPQIPS